MAAFKAQHPSARRERPQTLTRSLLLGLFLGLWMLGLVARLYSLQIVQYTELLARAQRQQQRTIGVDPKRGVLFDRNLRPLAMSLDVDSIYAVPAEMQNPEMVARLLAPALGLDVESLQGRFRAFRSFCWVKRKVSDGESARVHGLNLKGIYYQKETKRFYPKGALAAHVLGYVGMDGNGLAGLEHQLDSRIKGRPGRVLVDSDARHQTFRSSEWAGESGKNVVLTLDENIQYMAEKALAEAVHKWRAAGGTAIVQDSNTGEILAMASRPTFRPLDFAKSPPEARRNRAVAWVYEPGSTFKLITLAAALEENLTTPEEVINCQEGDIVLAGHVIHDHKPFGYLTVSQILAKSSDVGAIKVGLRLGEDRLYRHIRNFGFDSRTGIELPGEEQGLLKPPQRWSGISVGEISMGQEIGVTPIQLVTAYSAVANGGILLQPRLVRDVYLDNQHDPLPPTRSRRLLNERTAAMMKQMLRGVVEDGTGMSASPSGYSAAGKTGTAQTIDASGRYSHSHYVASFAGFVPATQPMITILVVIDFPVGAIHGQEVAAPVFRSIAEQTLGYLNIPQDHPSRWLQVVSSSPADSPHQTRRELAGILPLGPGSSGAATPPVRLASFSSRLPRPTPNYLRTSGPVHGGNLISMGGSRLKVPEFSGLAVRQVAAKCQELGLDLKLSGSGLAVEQDPPAGSQLPAGTSVWVRFAR